MSVNENNVSQQKTVLTFRPGWECIKVPNTWGQVCNGTRGAVTHLQRQGRVSTACGQVVGACTGISIIRAVGSSSTRAAPDTADMILDPSAC